MNGLGLLIVLTSLGAEATWEENPNGTLSYTIRVDRDALPELVSGEQAFITEVEPKDRHFREFQVMLPGKDPRTPSINSRSPNDDTVQLGWVPAADGGLEFYIQMSPERFGTFSKGTLVRGRVPPEVTDIRKVFVFVGIKELEQVLNPVRETAQPVAPDFTGRNRFSAAQVSAEQNSVPAPRMNSSTYSASDTIQQLPLSAPDNRQQRVYDKQGREPNDHLSREAADRDLTQPSKSLGGDRSAYDRPGYDRPEYDGTGYDRTNYNQRRYDGPDYDPAPQYADRGYQERQIQLVANQVRQELASAQQPAPQQQYSNRQPTYTPQAAPSQQQFAAPQPQSPAPAAAWPAAAAATPPATSVTTPTAGKDVHPWGPLILTTMALFTSLGANAYLGWLAWSFFWRFKDMASDVVRARSQSSLSRQAA